jgi:hypothetical protein
MVVSRQLELVPLIPEPVSLEQNNTNCQETETTESLRQQI